MKIYSNSPTQNIIFGAELSERAQNYINRQFEGIKRRSGNYSLNPEYNREYTNFAKDTIRQIKKLDPAKFSLIDLNETGDKFVCETYKTAEDMAARTNRQDSKTVSISLTNPLLDVLLDLKTNLFEYSTKLDLERYNKMRRLDTFRKDMRQ